MIVHDRPPSEEDFQAWIDDRLSGEARVRVNDYLAHDPATAARVTRQRELSAALRIALRAQFPDDGPRNFRSEVLARSPARPALPWQRAAALIVAMVLGAVTGGGGVALWVSTEPASVTAADSGSTLARDAFLAHATYTVEQRHFVEVEASEPHLLRWLSNRLKTQVVAPDLRDVGYSLIGGRLVPTLEGLAAQLMYEDARGARLTLYLRHDARGQDATLHFEARDGANGATWADRGIGYALFAPIDRDRLLIVAKSVQAQVHGGDPRL